MNATQPIDFATSTHFAPLFERSYALTSLYRRFAPNKLDLSQRPIPPAHLLLTFAHEQAQLVGDLGDVAFGNPSVLLQALLSLRRPQALSIGVFSVA